MRPEGRGNSIEWLLKSAVAFLILASASLVEAQTIQTLCSFNGRTNGANPDAGLTLGNDGNFYGTTYGNRYSYGTVFKVTTNGTLTTLVSFTGANGLYPNALTLGNDGNFYGTTSDGGGGYGTVFKVTTNGTLTTLASFNDFNGATCEAGLTLGNDGNFYGTTYWGGSENGGTVFKVTTNGTLTSLYSFGTIQDVYGDPLDGTSPQAALVQGSDGHFYGTTANGGTPNFNSISGFAGDGTVFKISTDGALTTLHLFTGGNDGEWPMAGLVQGSDGNFYGTTQGGGANGAGTVFKIRANGAFSSLYSFTGGNDGANPQAGLVQGSDGNFYGTTQGGGGYGNGTAFQVTTNGTLTTLVSFTLYPNALTLGNDGNFYGTTYYGGSGGNGTVFRLMLMPVITVQPQSHTNNAGATVTFFVSTATPSLMGYQWQMNGTNLVNGGNISGATTSTLTITNISDSDAASYSVIVSYANSSVTTSNATLTVIDPPVITAQPANLLVSAGTNVAFGVSVTGTAPFGYQWRFNGTNILNAMSALYSIPSVGTNNAGSYSVVITNGAGTATSSNAALTVVLSPKSRTNYATSTATFTAAAFGPESLNYQWQKNGMNLVEGGRLSGTSNSTLTITSIADADAASYRAVVSDAYGSMTTSNATLTVIDPPLITAQPTNLLVLSGTNVAFGVSPSGSAPFFYYQWQFNGTNILNATSALYSIPSVGTNNAGYYAVVVTNLAGSTTSSNAALTVVLSPKSRTNYASSTATFTATAFSAESLNYQWQKNGTNLVDGGRLSGTTNSTLTIASVSDEDAANYSAVVSDAAGIVTSSNAVLTVNDLPFIASQPQSQTVSAGRMVTFDVTAYGAPPLVFQWYFNGTPVGSPATGTNVSSYALTNVGTNQAGNYSVEVVNGYGRVTSSDATLTVVVPPIITTQPVNRTNKVATTATFSVVAASASPLSYQWQKNGTNLANGGQISGVRNSSLTITNVSDNDAAIYSVTVTNLAGTTTSSNATLTVIDPPSITAQPLSQRVLSAGSISFSVSISGTPPFSYQWRFNGTNLLNATNAAYAIQAVAATDTGKYSVVVTNLAGSATSSTALLTVIVPPRLALQFLAGYPLLDLSGMLSSNFVVQYITNLSGTNWANLLSLTNLPSSPYPFLDSGGVGQPSRFYRAFMR